MPPAWEAQQRIAIAAAAFYGASLLTLTILTTEAALAAIGSLPAEKPRLRLVTLYGRRIDQA